MKEGIENKRKERNTLKKDQVNLKKIILLAIRINNLKKSPQALAGIAQWIEHKLQPKGRQFNSQSGHMPGL